MEGKGNLRISIVAPYYNIPEEYFKPFVRSVLSQDYDNYELIIVNDGSTKEECLSMLGKLDDPHIRLIHKENGGCPSARNKGIEDMSGDILYLADPDDELCPGLLRKLAETFEMESDLECLCLSYYTRNDEGEVRLTQLPEMHVTGKACFECLCNHRRNLGRIRGYVWNKAFNVNRIGKDNIIRFDSRLKRVDDKFWVMQMFYQLDPGKETVRLLDYPAYIYNNNASGVLTVPAKWVSYRGAFIADHDYILDFVSGKEGKGDLYYYLMATVCEYCFMTVWGLLINKAFRTADDNPRSKLDRLRFYQKELKGKDITWEPYTRKRKWIPLTLLIGNLLLRDKA